MSINNADVLGEKNKNLVLETAGKIYVKVADRYYELHFRDQENGVTTIINQTPNVEIPENEQQDFSKYVTKAYLKSTLCNYITKRGWEDIQETKRLLEDAQLEGFTESINPITVSTMQLIVGSENLQYNFISDLKPVTGTTKDNLLVVAPQIAINSSDELTCPECYILHTKLDGPQAVQPNLDYRYYARWTIQGDISREENSKTFKDTKLYLEDPSSPYYLYIKVPKYRNSNNKEYTDDEIKEAISNDQDLKGSGIGEFVVTKYSYELDSEDSYFLLCAIITSSTNGVRSIGYMNGFTEVLPGQITAYVFKTSDGLQYLDFLNGAFHIGKGAEFLDYHPDTGLTITGQVNITGGNTYNMLEDLQKQIDDEVQAWFSDDENNDNPIATKHSAPTLDSWPANKWKPCIDAYIVSGATEKSATWLKDTSGNTITPDTNTYYKIRTSGSYYALTFKWNGTAYEVADYDDTYNAHYGDLYYIVEGTLQGSAYRFTVKNGTYQWIEVADHASTEAILIAREAKKEAGEASTAAGNINIYLGKALKDGVLTVDEISSLETYLKTLASEMQDVVSSYGTLIKNDYLQEDSAQSTREALTTSFLALYKENTGAYQVLKAAIQAIIDEGPTEVNTTNSNLTNLITAYETAYNNFNSALGNYSEAVEKTNQYIEKAIYEAAQTYIDSGYGYLKEALHKGTTTIAGGLILTNCIALGNTIENGGNISAGINGINTIDGTYNPKAIAAWYGGPMQDLDVLKANLEKDPTATYTKDDYAMTIFRHDGSGYEAGGNIYWDENGYGGVGGGLISWGKDENGEFKLTIGDDVTMGDTLVSQIVGLYFSIQSKFWLWEKIFTLHFKKDADGNDTSDIESVEFNYSTWTDGYLSARGKDSTESSGGEGTDLETVWNSLSTNTDAFGKVLIHSDHIKNIPQENITGLTDTIQQLRDSITGTVTSVGLAMPTGFVVKNSPITSTGILEVSMAPGYSLLTDEIKSTITTLTEMFLVQSDNSVKLNPKYKGLWTEGFLSARGEDNEGGSGGGGGSTLSEMWESLQNNDLPFADVTINVAHIPENIPIEKILNLGKTLESKQDTLISGTNIKTINNESLLGSGNINVPILDQNNKIKKENLPTNTAFSLEFIINGELQEDGVSYVMNINHNLGKRPSITVIDSNGNEVFVQVTYLDENNLSLSWDNVSLSGRVYIV